MCVALQISGRISPGGLVSLSVCNQICCKIIIMQSNMQIKLQIVLKKSCNFIAICHRLTLCGIGQHSCRGTANYGEKAAAAMPRTKKFAGCF